MKKNYKINAKGIETRRACNTCQIRKQEFKKQSGFTNSRIYELSGIPLSTLNKIFSGTTANSRYATLLAIEEVLVTKEKIPFTYDKLQEMPMMVRKAGVPYQYRSREYSDSDISVICRKEILSDRGCEGAPDWLIEVISSSNSKHDYVTKLMQYQKAGVREYWIIDPFQRMTYVYNFENSQLTDSYSYEECVPSSVLQGLEIKLEEIEKQY